MTEFDPGEERCCETLRKARWPDRITCPACGGSRITLRSRSRKTPRRRYLCPGCRGPFSDLTGTLPAQTNLPRATWLECRRLPGRRCTTSDLANAVDVKWDTAERLRRQLTPGLGRPGLVQRFRRMLGEEDQG